MIFRKSWFMRSGPSWTITRCSFRHSCGPVADPALASRALPAVRAAKLVYVGPYEAMEKAYAAIYAWINENGYQALSPMREISVRDPAVTPPDRLVTEICVPIERI